MFMCPISHYWFWKSIEMRRIPRYMRCVSMCVRMCLGAHTPSIYLQNGMFSIKKDTFKRPWEMHSHKNRWWKTHTISSRSVFLGWFCSFGASIHFTRAAPTTFIISLVTFSISTISRLPHTSFACCLSCSDFHRTCFHSTRAAPATASSHSPCEHTQFTILEPVCACVCVQCSFVCSHCNHFQRVIIC